MQLQIKSNESEMQICSCYRSSPLQLQIRIFVLDLISENEKKRYQQQVCECFSTKSTNRLLTPAVETAVDILCHLRTMSLSATLHLWYPRPNCASTAAMESFNTKPFILYIYTLTNLLIYSCWNTSFVTGADTLRCVNNSAPQIGC